MQVLWVWGQFGTVIVCESRPSAQAEQQYSKECLTIAYAMKQFCHYLLDRLFKLTTDHAPLQWLSAKKMEGLLCRWALRLQKYAFSIVYQKGSQNQNADALSRLDTTTVCSHPTLLLF